MLYCIIKWSSSKEIQFAIFRFSSSNPVSVGILIFSKLELIINNLHFYKFKRSKTWSETCENGRFHIFLKSKPAKKAGYNLLKACIQNLQVQTFEKWTKCLTVHVLRLHPLLLTFYTKSLFQKMCHLWEHVIGHSFANRIHFFLI